MQMFGIRRLVVGGSVRHGGHARGRPLPCPACPTGPDISSSASSLLSRTMTSYFDGGPSAPETSRPKQQRRLDIAIVGAPNAGKSQLLNSLVGSKVAAVSRKRHTTRSGILGARTFGDTQLVFIDTPGFLHHSKGAREGVRNLLSEASAEMMNADFALLVVDAAKTIDQDLKRTLVTLMMLALRSTGREEGSRVFSDQRHLGRFSVVLNKVDLVKPKEKLLATAAEVGSLAESCVRRLLQQHRAPVRVKMGELVDSVLERHEDEEGFAGVHEEDYETFASVVPEFLFTSAIDPEDEGADDLLNVLLSRATPSTEFVMDPSSNLEQVEEIIREKIYRCLHREVPHHVQQTNRVFKLKQDQPPDHDVRADMGDLLQIHQDLIVRTKSHHRLVLGSGGKTLQRIQTTASKDLRELFGCEVDLLLSVKLKKTNQGVLLDPEEEGARITTLHD
mmetsp:Transcript_21712/g.51147  ORF Transcript_21712/g.51147 Transcript_21712/m.51147 type:complete len:448 (-) Transcript_21712:512-1855(-)